LTYQLLGRKLLVETAAVHQLVMRPLIDIGGIEDNMRSDVANRGKR